MPKKYHSIGDIPFCGDVREYLMNFCRASRDSKFRELENMAHSSPSSEQLDDVLDCYESEADKWHICFKWLEAQDEA